MESPLYSLSYQQVLHGIQGLLQGVSPSGENKNVPVFTHEISIYWKNSFGFWTLIKSFNFLAGSNMLLWLLYSSPYCSNATPLPLLGVEGLLLVDTPRRAGIDKVIYLNNDKYIADLPSDSFNLSTVCSSLENINIEKFGWELFKIFRKYLKYYGNIRNIMEIFHCSMNTGGFCG